MSSSYETSGRLAYLKLAFMAALMRGGAKIGGLIGKFPLNPIPTPQETLVIQSTKGTRLIRVFVHRNKAAEEASKEGKPTVVHIHWYGGGWMLPYNPSQAAGIVNALLDSTDLSDYPLTIVEATYALAPQYPCPAALEDAKDVYSHFASHPKMYDPERITVSGASSGGAIALGLSVTLAQARRQDASSTGDAAAMTGHPIKGAVLLYPLTSWIDIMKKIENFSVQPPSGKKMWPGIMLPSIAMDIITGSQFVSPVSFWATPLSKEVDEKRKEELIHRPSVSPALAGLADFPPSVKIWTAEYDVMSLDADKLRDRIETRNNGAQKGKCGMNIKGVGHGWDIEVKEGQIGWEEKVEALQSFVEVVAKAGGLEV